MGIVGCTYLECFREEEALLDVVLGGVDGVDVLHARVAALHATVPLDRLKCKGRNYNLQASFFLYGITLPLQFKRAAHTVSEHKSEQHPMHLHKTTRNVARFNLIAHSFGVSALAIPGENLNVQAINSPH